MTETTLPQVPGIYKIVNKQNGKLYVGSTVNLLIRYRSHITTLRRKRHANKYLQNAFNKYGEENFSFEIIETCDTNDIIEREDFWITKLRSHKSRCGYNIISKAEKIYPRTGIPHNDESKRKISDTKKLNGTIQCGEDHNLAKLTAEQVNQIRKLKNSGATFRQLRHLFKISDGAIIGIMSGHSWKCVEYIDVDVSGIELPEFARKKPSNNPQQKLSDDDVVRIREMAHCGVSNKNISQHFNVAPSTITGIVFGSTRRDAGGPIKIKPNNDLSDNQMQTLLSMRRNNASFAVIAKAIGVSTSVAWQSYNRHIKTIPGDEPVPQAA